MASNQLNGIGFRPLRPRHTIQSGRDRSAFIVDNTHPRTPQLAPSGPEGTVTGAGVPTRKRR